MLQEGEDEEEYDESQHLQVNVAILEARHLVVENTDSKVEVVIGKKRKSIRSKTAKTDAPYFNELCIFKFYLPLRVFLDEILHVRIYGAPKLRRNKLIGSFSVELATIWLQPNHQFYHKWATLMDPKNPTAGVKGYLKCDIEILPGGAKSKPLDANLGENIDDHLLVPFGEVNDRQKAKFVFSLFRADNLSEHLVVPPLKSLRAFVRITFAGVSGKTHPASETFRPSWNAEVAFVEMIPALCQFVHVELCDANRPPEKGVLGAATLDLRKLSREGETGFLPTYGPSFLYLYYNFAQFDKHTKCSFVSSNFTYRCRLLIALRTEVVDYAEDVLARKTNLAVTKPKSIPTLDESRYFRYSEFILFAAVFDILMFDAPSITHNVSVRVNLGAGRPVEDDGFLVPPAGRPEPPGAVDRVSIRSKKAVTFREPDVKTVRFSDDHKSDDSLRVHLDEIEGKASRFLLRPFAKQRDLFRRLRNWYLRKREYLTSEDECDTRGKDLPSDEVPEEYAIEEAPSSDSLVTAVSSTILDRKSRAVSDEESKFTRLHVKDSLESMLQKTTDSSPKRTSSEGKMWKALRSLGKWPTHWRGHKRRKKCRRRRRRSCSPWEWHTWKNMKFYTDDSEEAKERSRDAEDETVSDETEDDSGDARRRDLTPRWEPFKSLRRWPTEWRKRPKKVWTGMTEEEEEAAYFKLSKMIDYDSEDITGDDDENMSPEERQLLRRLTARGERSCLQKKVCEWRQKVSEYDKRILLRHSRLRQISTSAKHWKLLRDLREWPSDWGEDSLETDDSGGKSGETATGGSRDDDTSLDRENRNRRRYPTMPLPPPPRSILKRQRKDMGIQMKPDYRTTASDQTDEGGMDDTSQEIPEGDEASSPAVPDGMTAADETEGKESSDTSEEKVQNEVDYEQESEKSSISQDENEPESGKPQRKSKPGAEDEEDVESVSAESEEEDEEEESAEKKSEKELKEEIESAKSKKRYWYGDKASAKDSNIFSPDNTTDMNVAVYMAAKKRAASWLLKQGAERKWVFWGKKKESESSESEDVNEVEDDYTDESEEEEHEKEESEEEATAEPDQKEEEEAAEESGEQEGEPFRVKVYNGCNETGQQKITVQEHYGFASLSGRYPCVHVNGVWPNSLRRMYRSNIIYRSVKRFKSDLRDVENELASENRIEASERLKKIFADLRGECQEILDLTARVEPEDTNLYRERRRFYHRELRDMIVKMEAASKRKVLVAEDELKRAYEYLSTLKRYAEDPEESFPDAEIWLIRDGKEVAQQRLRTRRVAFSTDDRERGVASGKVQSVVLRGKQGEVVAKLEMFLWFGLGAHFFHCRNLLPPGFDEETHTCPGTGIGDIPVLLTYSEVRFFKCRVHLFQARIVHPADTNALANPFVRVTFSDQNRESQVLKETLNPTWDEMLEFPRLTVYGRAEAIADNSVVLTVEVFDHDQASRNELIGRTLVRPTVGLLAEEYAPPRLSWEDMKKDCFETGKILLAAELLEVSEGEPETTVDKPKPLPIPRVIRPHAIGYRLEVLFWGVRELKKKQPGSSKLFVTLECGGKLLTSPILKNPTKTLNFRDKVQILQLHLPEENEYKPPLVLKMFQTNPFARGSETYVGNCIIPSVKAFICETVDDEERKRKELEYKELLKETELEEEEEKKDQQAMQEAEMIERLWLRLNAKLKGRLNKVVTAVERLCKRILSLIFKDAGQADKERAPESEGDDTADWWVKYYASKERKGEEYGVETLVIYDEELEAQPEFRGFSDFIYTFNMIAGKSKKNVDSEVVVGKVKAAVKLYKWPLPEDQAGTLYGLDLRKGLLRQLPSNAAIKYVVRVYVVSCRNLTPKDIYGKSDPYLILQIGGQKISEVRNYIPKQVNPVFGKCFEFRGTFPEEHLLRIRVMDHDILSEDELIGETFIDLENRYYTKHHASCGIPKTYTRKGFAAWRDVYQPTEILRVVCKQSNMEAPVFTEESVRVGEYEFRADTAQEKYRMEMHALVALNRWHEIPLRGFRLVPEHIESRPLYHPAFPGVEQGKIEMWVEIFPADFRYVPPIVDIQPRKPVPMELRAIIWNVEGIILDEATFLINERLSDIYVQGWMTALEEDKQSTDVHYRTMNGEGSFNWRFVFPFLYVSPERRLVVYKKKTPLDTEPEEVKFPCRLELQVWDNDVAVDDFIGSLNLELCSMPRGAKISTRCKLSMFEESAPRINLFKIGRIRGWWPFRRIIDAESSLYRLAGKVDLELEVVTESEALEHPVGRGRDEPKPLPEPKRPETAFIWILNPIKTFRFIVFRKYKRQMITLLILGMAVAFVLLAVYAIPGYTVKRLIGA